MRRRNGEPAYLEEVGQADSVTGLPIKNMPYMLYGMQV